MHMRNDVNDLSIAGFFFVVSLVIRIVFSLTEGQTPQPCCPQNTLITIDVNLSVTNPCARFFTSKHIGWYILLCSKNFAEI